METLFSVPSLAQAMSFQPLTIAYYYCLLPLNCYVARMITLELTLFMSLLCF